jgi:hypothetical protein
MSVRGPRYFISCDSSSQAWWVARFYEPQFCPYCGGKIVFRSTDERRPLVLKSLQRLSPWTEVPDTAGKCWMRFLEGTDPSDVANRVAFIEKTARVRLAEMTDPGTDSMNWFAGPKGADGNDQRVRDWCDEHLVELGYSLEGDDE